MQKRLEDYLRTFPRAFITDDELAQLTDGTKDSRYSKVKRLLAQNKLLHVRRGLYCLTDNLQPLIQPHPFELAQYIYGPSYISLESALSFHQLIPETVHTVTSTTIKRANEFKTPVGLFSYQHLPPENFYTDVELVTENNYHFYMAKPWKAICDYIFCYRREWKTIESCLGDLRIDQENLPIICDEEIEILNKYYQRIRVTRFLKLIRRFQKNNAQE